MNENFDEKLMTFLEGCQALVTTHRAGTELSVEPGQRYVKILAESHGSRSVWAFVDKTNGDVLKAASYKAPAKHARGDIFDDKNGLGTVTAYGPAYLR